MIRFLHSLRPILIKYQENPSLENSIILLNILENSFNENRELAGIKKVIDLSIKEYKNDPFIQSMLIYKTFQHIYPKNYQLPLLNLNEQEIYENSVIYKNNIEIQEKSKISVFKIFQNLFSKQTNKINSYKNYKESDLI